MPSSSAFEFLRARHDSGVPDWVEGEIEFVVLIHRPRAVIGSPASHATVDCTAHRPGCLQVRCHRWLDPGRDTGRRDLGSRSSCTVVEPSNECYQRAECRYVGECEASPVTVRSRAQPWVIGSDTHHQPPPRPDAQRTQIANARNSIHDQSNFRPTQRRPGATHARGMGLFAAWCRERSRPIASAASAWERSRPIASAASACANSVEAAAAVCGCWWCGG